jgi:hypothetical protein
MPNKRMTSEEKAAKEARKAVVCNAPGTDPDMFYFTERCILKEDAHQYRRRNRRAATFQKRAVKEYTAIHNHMQTLKIDNIRYAAALHWQYVPLRKHLFMHMIDPDDMKTNTSPRRRYRRLFEEAVGEGYKTNIKSVIKANLGAEIEKLVMHDTHQYFYSVAANMYKFSSAKEK